MKLLATPVPYSSIVGGGIMLIDEKGRSQFQMMIRGTVAGITKEQSDAIAIRICELINHAGTGIEVSANDE